MKSSRRTTLKLILRAVGRTGDVPADVWACPCPPLVRTPLFSQRGRATAQVDVRRTPRTARDVRMPLCFPAAFTRRKPDKRSDPLLTMADRCGCRVATDRSIKRLRRQDLLGISPVRTPSRRARLRPVGVAPATKPIVGESSGSFHNPLRMLHGTSGERI
jgi:hypothetical protein